MKNDLRKDEFSFEGVGIDPTLSKPRGIIPEGGGSEEILSFSRRMNSCIVI